MCTSLLYSDAADRAYLGRTLELSLELPYQVSFVPEGLSLTSQVEGYAAVDWKVRYAYLGITMPGVIPTKPLESGDLKVVEGVNTAGLTFSVQSYPTAGGPDETPDPTQAMLSTMDLGAWVLGQFSTVAEVKAAVATQAMLVPVVPILGGQKMPFHYSVHDAAGNSLVIEFHFGKRKVYDNPVGVMTNAPEFDWHLTNLNNYTFLTNVDNSKSAFGKYAAAAPGAGIAKAGLPVTDTSVDRFVRAAFYAQYAEKQTDADKAVQMVAHIMNNFDRPRGITIDPPDQGSSHLHMVGQEVDEVPTEYTSWTSITDLSRLRFYVRDRAGMNYVAYDLKEMAKKSKAFRSLSLASMMAEPVDLTASFA